MTTKRRFLQMLGLAPLAAIIPAAAANVEQPKSKFKPVQWVECPDCTATLRVFEGSEPICGYCQEAETAPAEVRAISFGGSTVTIGTDPDQARYEKMHPPLVNIGARALPAVAIPFFGYNQSAEYNNEISAWHSEISAGQPYDGDATCDVAKVLTEDITTITFHPAADEDLPVFTMKNGRTVQGRNNVVVDTFNDEMVETDEHGVATVKSWTAHLSGKV